MNLSEIIKSGAYEHVLTEDLADIHAEGCLLRHKKSGARVMLIPSEDDNKVFNIAFRTPPGIRPCILSPALTTQTSAT